MTDADMMDAMADAVAGYVARACAPLVERIARLESDLATRPDAKAHAEFLTRAAMDAAAAVPRAADGAPGATGEKGAPGEPGPMGPEGKAGPAGEVPLDTVRLMVLEEIGKAVGVLPRAADGKSVTIEEVTPLLERMVAALPKAKDGIDGKDGAQGAEGPAGAQGEKGADGRDGAAGERGEVGPVGEKGADGLQGKDGRDGIDGKDADPEVVRAIAEEFVARAVEAIPKAIDGKDGAPGRDGRDGLQGASGEKGLDGANGRDGADGLGFDDMEATLGDDGRTVTLRYVRGDVVKDFTLEFPVPVYQGVWKQARYARGACVTYAGSQWIALRETEGAPTKSADWQLAVKKGKDGRDE